MITENVKRIENKPQHEESQRRARANGLLTVAHL